MAARELLDATGKISAQFLPESPLSSETIDICPQGLAGNRILSLTNDGGPVNLPYYSDTNFPTIVGKSYMLQGTLQISSISATAQTWDLSVFVAPSQIEGVVSATYILRNLPRTATTSAPYIVPFCVVFKAQSTQSYIWFDAGEALDAGNSSTITLRNVYLTELT